MSDTNIPVSDAVWSELNQRKQRGDTFDDVLRRVLDMDGQSESQATAPETESQSDDGGRDPAVTVPEDVPQTVDDQQAREAVAAAVQYLEDEGSASMREIVADVMPQHDLGYDVPELEPGERYRGSWWRRVVKPGFEQQDSVASPAPGQSDWRFVG